MIYCCFYYIIHKCLLRFFLNLVLLIPEFLFLPLISLYFWNLLFYLLLLVHALKLFFSLLLILQYFLILLVKINLFWCLPALKFFLLLSLELLDQMCLEQKLILFFVLKFQLFLYGCMLWTLIIPVLVLILFFDLILITNLCSLLLE